MKFGVGGDVKWHIDLLFINARRKVFDGYEALTCYCSID